MGFSEAIKLKVKKKADFRCCMCQGLVHDVHHIIPEKNNGPNTIANAAPLCAGCHRTHGNNPDFRKTIRQIRDHWYETCESKRKALPLYEKTIFEKVDDIQREMKGGFAEVRSALADFYKGKLHEIESAATPHGLSEAISAIVSGTSMTPSYVCPKCKEPMTNISKGEYKCENCVKPKLKIGFYEQILNTTTTGIRGWYYILQVANDNRMSPAKSVKILLTKVLWKGLDDSWQEQRFSGPAPVMWRFPPHDGGKTVGPEIEATFGCLMEDSNLFQLQLNWWPNNLQKEISPREPTRLEFKAVSETVDSKVLTIEVDWNGKWDKDPTEMAKNCSVIELSS